MDDKTYDASDKVSARRRLLRGALSVPTVMTLSSGSALAASSSLVCASKLPDTVTGSSIPGNFFQVQRYTATKTGIQAGTRRLVKGADITLVATNQKFLVGSFGAAWIDVSNGADATTWVTSAPATIPTPETGKTVALRFENTGTDLAPVFTVKGLSDAAQPGVGTGKVMSMSCWNSFK